MSQSGQPSNSYRPGPEPAATTRFTYDDQLEFARLSGDHNEIHIDRLAARRSLPGDLVVHGVHTVLWAIEAFLGTHPTGIRSLTASFPKPIFLDEQVKLEVVSVGDDATRLQVSVDSTVAVDVRLQVGPIAGIPADELAFHDLATKAEEPPVADLAGMRGALVVPSDRGEWSDRFPRLAETMGPAFVAQLAAVSRLVGMVCPGRYSMLSGFTLHIEPGSSPRDIDWEVTRADLRVGAVRMALSGGNITGSVDAFARPAPVVQPRYSDLAPLVRHGEFETQRALVVGGSRGLGELMAKILATGGSDVVLTWHRGSEEADRVVHEITTGGGRAASTHLDVVEPSDFNPHPTDPGWAPTHLYYFASPKIFARRTRALDREMFDGYFDVYVGGFTHVVEACRDLGSEHLAAFYPSTVAIDEGAAALTEYAAAKAAGEVVARTLAASRRWLDVTIERLPRMPTDQTASILPVPSEDATPIMLAIGRRMTSPQTEPGDD